MQLCYMEFSDEFVFLAKKKVIYRVTSVAQIAPIYKGREADCVNAWCGTESKPLKKEGDTTPIVLQ